MKKKVLVIASLVVMMAGLIGVIQPQAVSANHNPNHNPEPKITICHRDNNVLQPYGPKAIEVNLSAVDGDGNSDHFGQHTGPLASSFAYAVELKFDGTKWGDIIPPTEAHPEGLNWTAIGEAMWKNDCQYVASATPKEVIFTDPTCDTLGSYTIPKTKGVKYLINGEVVTKGEYNVQTGETITVTAEAKTGYYLTGTTEWSHTFYAPKDCDEEEIADIKYGVVCSANGALVTLTNEGNVEGDVTLNGEVITVAAGATVERTFETTDAGIQITITIDEKTVYDELVVCDTGDVLGDTDTPAVLPNTSGSIAPTIIAAIASLSLIAGLISLAVRSTLTRQ